MRVGKSFLTCIRHSWLCLVVGAAGCPVWDEALNCPVPATASSRQHWNGWKQPNTHQNLNEREGHVVPLLGGSCQGKKHMRRQGRRNWRRDMDGDIVGGIAGGVFLEEGGPSKSRDIPQTLQPWVTHTRAGTVLRDSSPWVTHSGTGMPLSYCSHVWPMPGQWHHQEYPLERDCEKGLILRFNNNQDQNNRQCLFPHPFGHLCGEKRFPWRSNI